MARPTSPSEFAPIPAYIPATDADSTRRDNPPVPRVRRLSTGGSRALRRATCRPVLTLLAEENIDILAPVFPHLMRIVRSTYDELGAAAKDMVDTALLSLIDRGSHILSVDINRLFLVQVLSRRHTDAKENAIVAMYADTANVLVRRMILHALANWDCRSSRANCGTSRRRRRGKGVP